MQIELGLQVMAVITERLHMDNKLDYYYCLTHNINRNPLLDKIERLHKPNMILEMTFSRAL